MRKGLRGNLLREFYLELADILEISSQEAQDKERIKRKRKTAAESPPRTPPSIFPIIPPTNIPIVSELDCPTTSMADRARYPTNFTTPQKKRDLSGSSMGQKSTETTPTKWTHPETKVQSLLNTFVKALVNGLWDGNIKMPWVTGRYMYLTYSEYSLHVISANWRTSDTSFQYILGIDDDGNPLRGRVRAIADGALILKTNKAKDPNSTLIWSKQQSVLAFEVLSQYLNIIMLV